MKELWVEKYRPKTIDGYVFRDDHQRKQIQTWIHIHDIASLYYFAIKNKFNVTFFLRYNSFRKFDKFV
jgi:hypothetical protein